MLKKTMMCLVLALLAAVLVAPAGAREHGMNLVPQGVYPAWTAVPQAPGVVYAPNLPVDLFRYGNSYYHYQKNIWRQGPTMNGPWQHINQPPPAFYQIQAPYFKYPPGWARGRKTGWRGAPMPPGQMKKYEGEPPPPGQMRKYY